MKEHYTKAVLALLGHDASKTRVEEVIANLGKVLNARGHSKLLPGILRGVLKHYEHQKDIAAVVVLREATEAELKKYKDEIAASPLSPEMKTLSIKEDTSLIGGYTLTVDDRMIDRSYKAQLLELYRNITT